MGVRLALMVRDQPFANFKEGSINRIHFSMNKNIFGTRMLFYNPTMSKLPRCVRLHSIFIGDSDNVSLMTMRFYLVVLSMAGLIMMRPVVHLPTFQPPVDNASLGALSPVKDFYCR